MAKLLPQLAASIGVFSLLLKANERYKRTGQPSAKVHIKYLISKVRS